MGISGVYNCFGLADHLHRRGLYRSLFDRIMSINGKPQLKLLSPIYCIKVGPLQSSSMQRPWLGLTTVLENMPVRPENSWLKMIEGEKEC